MSHSKLAPSKFSRYMTCPASYYLENQIEDEDEDDDAAADGTRLHNIMAILLNNKLNNARLEEPYISAEDQEIVDTCMDIVDNLYKPNMQVLIELQVAPIISNSLVIDLAGTPDLVLIDHEEQHIHLIDWKFGRVPVDQASENMQGMIYMSTIVSILPKDARRNYMCSTYFVQPKIEYYTEHHDSSNSYLMWQLYVLAPAIQNIFKAEKQFNPGHKQCKYCVANTTCKAYIEFIIDDAKIIDLYKDIDNFVDSSELYKKCKEIKKYSSLADKIVQYVNNNYTGGAPGFKSTKSRGSNTWSANEPEVAEALLNVLSIEEVYNSELISPSRAKKLMSAADYKQIAHLVEYTPGANKFVLIDDGEADAANAFKHLV